MENNEAIVNVRATDCLTLYLISAQTTTQLQIP